MTPFQLAGVSGTDGTLQTVTIADLDGNARAIDADVLLPFYGLSQDLGPIRDWGLGDSRRGVAINPSRQKQVVPASLPSATWPNIQEN